MSDHKKNHVVLNGVKEYRYEVDQKGIISLLKASFQNDSRDMNEGKALTIFSMPVLQK